jgi:hypothetical protein
LYGFSGPRVAVVFCHRFIPHKHLSKIAWPL